MVRPIPVFGIVPGMYMLSVKAGDGAVVRPIIVR
jgi:LEA14-like dessication related protein